MVPNSLKIPAIQTLSLETHATGVQIYDCKLNKDDPTRFEWVFNHRKPTCSTRLVRKIGKLRITLCC